PAVPVCRRGAGRDPERDRARLAVHRSRAARERLSPLLGGVRAARLGADAPVPPRDRAVPSFSGVPGADGSNPARLDRGLLRSSLIASCRSRRIPDRDRCIYIFEGNVINPVGFRLKSFVFLLALLAAAAGPSAARAQTPKCPMLDEY